MKEYKIYRYLNPGQFIDPTDKPDMIIFPDQLNTYLPNKKLITPQGFRTLSTYFSSTDYDEPVIKVEYNFVLDQLGYVDYIEQEIAWTYEDGEWSEDTKKTIIPLSSQSQKNKEIKRRRENVVERLKTLAGEMGIKAYMIELFNTYSNETYSYANSGSDVLYTAIESSTISWLDSPLPNGRIARTAILEYLSSGIIK